MDCCHADFGLPTNKCKGTYLYLHQCILHNVPFRVPQRNIIVPLRVHFKNLDLKEQKWTFIVPLFLTVYIFERLFWNRWKEHVFRLHV